MASTFVKSFERKRRLAVISQTNDPGFSLHPVFPFPVYSTCPQRHFPLCVSKFTRLFLYSLFYLVACLPSFLAASNLRPFFLSACCVTVSLLSSLHVLFLFRLSLRKKKHVIQPSSVIFPTHFFFFPRYIQKFVRLIS